MNWISFAYFASAAFICFLLALLFLLKKRHKWTNYLYLTGIGIILIFCIGYWIGVDRPPFRTMGETRLWYSLFVSGIGFFIYRQSKQPAILVFATLMAAVYMSVNIFKPELHTKALMPALQSIWFVPHVIVYMLAYACMACVLIWAFIARYRKDRTNIGSHFAQIDQLLLIGIALLGMGMLFGAIWAKDAWGDYWTWDLKETWAAITWLAYIAVFHLRIRFRTRYKLAVWCLFVAFIFLQMCWYGINYLPEGLRSIHRY